MHTNIFDHITQQFHLPFTNPVLIFSLLLFIILIAPILLGRIKIPGIVGFIIAGILIGPNGFNILKKNSAIELFATIGLLYIMFIAGIELDLAEFKKKKHKSFIFGFLTFAVPILIGFPVCYYLLHYSLLTSILTASMFATHTLVAYPIVNKFGIAKNEAVAVTVGGTILTDTAVLIILAVIMGSVEGELNSSFWIQLAISLTIFTATVFIVIPRIAKWFFTKLESEKTSHYIFVLSVVFFSAFLAQLAGIEPIIGAFVAGLALNRLIPHSSILMNRIEFVGNALFIPFFLISVGMLVDLRVLFRGPDALIVAGALTVVAIVGKYFSATLTQWIFKYTKNQRLLIFGLSSAHAAATLAIILVGYKAKIIDDNILNGTIILILVTCVFASFATEKASRNIVSAEELTGPEIVQNQENILIPIADFNNMDTMLDLAVLFKDKSSDQPINLLSVVPDSDNAQANLLIARKKLNDSVKYASGNDTMVKVIATLDHNVSSGVLRIAKEKSANIIITGWPRKNTVIDKFLGDKSAALIEKSPANLFILHLHKPITVHTSIQLVCPPAYLMEKNMQVWLSKVCKLSVELSLSVDCFCDESTKKHIEHALLIMKSSVNFKFDSTEIWKDWRKLKERIMPDDFMIVVLDRKLETTYLLSLTYTQRKLEHLFESQTKLLIYPQI
ncbi:Kef-type K+ transport system membrane component KefB [Pedobacter cryoconitis]|uniref:Kef-type K+ transport system membrane component KefB n=1 Tax=Pedobacter cryoconitis TaxID=188932 RepID=A0A7W8YR55_9SPHI|nr:cation:proton antiporter [Pedobacter cryoconitis]MBB5620307.1 Kef-type K+ transport system membrane component KefB [Pedobacter cryoconitis]MBB5647117.1 Kef-type K+ transport system membrane component KefB [Pedobacter cryoconitis]